MGDEAGTAALGIVQTRRAVDALAGQARLVGVVSEAPEGQPDTVAMVHVTQSSVPPKGPRMNDGIDISIEIVLPDSPDLHLQIGDHIASFVEQVRRAGASVTIRPDPDDIDNELAEIRRSLSKIDGNEFEQTSIRMQVDRIESMNRLRRRALALNT